jgi:hypothetical protein
VVVVVVVVVAVVVVVDVNVVVVVVKMATPVQKSRNHFTIQSITEVPCSKLHNPYVWQYMLPTSPK